MIGVTHVAEGATSRTSIPRFAQGLNQESIRREPLEAATRVEPSAILVLAAVLLSAQDSYFPKGALDSYKQLDSNLARWYLSQLKALDEPSLLPVDYRFPATSRMYSLSVTKR